MTSENIFLMVLGFIWITGAIIQDLRRREVDNLWNFSLIFFALAYRAAVSIFSSDYWFAVNGFIGLGIFLVLGNLFYYSRVFAGGDAKLLIALGTILPLSSEWLTNFQIFGWFIFFLLLGGGIYVFIWACILAFLNRKRFFSKFGKQRRRYKHLFFVSFILFIIWIVFLFVFGQEQFALSGLLILLIPLLFVFAKSVEESSMIKSVSPSDVTEGDWLYEDIFIGGEKIKSTWDGVSKKELELIRKKCRKKVLIRQGIPFTPGFLFGLLGVIIALRQGLV